MGTDTLAACRRICNSNTSCLNVLGAGPGSLQPSPARSYAQDLTREAKMPCTVVQSFEKAPPPASKTTIGFALRGPTQLMCRLWSPTLIIVPGAVPSFGCPNATITELSINVSLHIFENLLVVPSIFIIIGRSYVNDVSPFTANSPDLKTLYRMEGAKYEGCYNFIFPIASKEHFGTRRENLRTAPR